MNGVTAWIWEIAFSEADMHRKLDGEPAEIIDPGLSFIGRLLRRIFPAKEIRRSA